MGQLPLARHLPGISRPQCPLTLEHWAADGGLAVFFFLAGLELKRELTLGSLSRPADALVPVAAALSGMVVPAAVYLGVNAALGGDPDGWAVPMATDIAFALGYSPWWGVRCRLLYARFS